ncbi:MAG: 5-oxoprolinase subunit PxpB [Cyclobacteriaceae bacterium]|nr:5-oxoprolinase subunit PxpB [Cyclobacteriaceae bacterium]UYN87252.1 MAG: 5-oxoprolinase subunit PxpB [Cyclobacteriaceae bacterium]
MKAVSIYPVSESALTICLGNELNAVVNDRVFRLYNHLRKQVNPFWKDLIPAYCTLTVVYDIKEMRKHSQSAFKWVSKQLKEAIDQCDDAGILPSRQLSIPVCYESEFGFDLKSLSKAKKLSIDQVIKLHTAQTYRVFMLGFLPGFPYMGIVNDKIATPRLSSPRKLVPAGSVGIAGNQTGIYPLDSPGGWNIIGRTPLQIFNPRVSVLTDTSLLQPGDEVKFYSITKEEFHSFDQENFNPLSA